MNSSPQPSNFRILILARIKATALSINSCGKWNALKSWGFTKMRLSRDLGWHLQLVIKHAVWILAIWAECPLVLNRDRIRSYLVLLYQEGPSLENIELFYSLSLLGTSWSPINLFHWTLSHLQTSTFKFNKPRLCDGSRSCQPANSSHQQHTCNDQPQ